MHDFVLPDDSARLTAHEAAWLVFLRAICPDNVPAPTLRGVQALRRALSPDGGGSADPDADRADSAGRNAPFGTVSAS